jgi:hypothetical protein
MVGSTSTDVDAAKKRRRLVAGSSMLASVGVEHFDVQQEPLWVVENVRLETT